MVVMDRLACDICMVSGRKVDVLEQLKLSQQLQGSEDRCATDAKAAVVCVGDEICGCEVALSAGNEAHQRATGSRQPMAGLIEALNEVRRRCHA